MAQPAGGQADLTIAKSGPATATAGNQIAYTVVVTNNGPAAAQNVRVVDALPSGMTFVAATASAGTCTGGVDCAIGNLAIGASATVRITATVNADATGLFTNTAQVSSSNPDPTPDNNTATAPTTVSALAALTLTKSVTPASAKPGDLVFYQIVVTNTGPSAAQNVTVTDNLPAEIFNPIVSSSQGGCTVFPCALGTLPAGGSATILVVGTLSQSAVGAIVNTATVSSTTPLSNPATDQTDTATVGAASLADLVLTKLATPNPVQAGTTLTYTLTVVNRGPGSATNVKITDTLPYGVDFGSGANCAETVSGSGVVVCTATTNPLPSGGSESFTFTVNVSSTLPTGISLVNRAVAGSDTTDPNPDNNTALADTEVLATANLLVSKTSAPDPVNAGELLTYTVMVTNTGPAQATDVRIVDTIPAQMTFLSATASNGGICNAGVLCLLGSLGLNETVTVTILVRVDGDLRAGTIINNKATVFSEQLDPPVPVTASDDTQITEEVSLTVQKQDFPDPAAVGGSLRYQLLVSNGGPSDAVNVKITDTLDINTTFVQASLGFNCTETSGILSCSIPNLPAGESRLIEVDVDVATGLADNTILTNTVKVASDSSEPVTIDNTDVETTTVRSGTDLSIAKTAADQVVAGHVLTYTIAVKNLGPSDALSVTVTDTLPSAILTPTVSFSSSTGSCVQDNNRILCDIGDMTLGVTDTVIITVSGQVDPTASVGSVLTNRAEGSTETFDFIATNNASNFDTLVVGIADLGITKAGPASAVAGLDIVTYTLVVSNSGPSQAQQVFVQDPLPVGLTLISVGTTKAGATCATGIGCSLGNLNVGEVVTITIVASVNADVAGGSIMTNTASVSGAVVQDPDFLPNSATTTADIVSRATLTIDKIDQFDPVAPGDPIFYRVAITNSGPSAAANLRITDTLPANVTFQSAGVDCLHDGSASGGTVTCMVTTLGVGERYEFDIVVFAPLDVISGTVLTNTVIAQADNSAQVSADEQTTVQQQFGPPADLVVDKSGSATAVAGGQVTYTVVITNNGPATAISPDLKDVLPAGVTLSSVSTSQGLCAPSTLGALCQFGNIGLNQVVTVTLVGDVAGTVVDGTVLTNTAQVFANNPDPAPADNKDTAATTVSASADLSIAKTVSPNPAVPGQGVTYQIVITNAGPSAAANVKITDTIPTELTGVTVSPSQGTCTGGNCDLGTIPAGGSGHRDPHGHGQPGRDRGLHQQRDCWQRHPGPERRQQHGDAPSDVAPSADLALGIVSSPTTQGGTTATVTVTVQNNGPSDAAGTVVTVTLPASTTVNDIASQLPSGWTAIDNGNGTVTITTTNVLTPGQSVNLPIVVNVDPAVEPGTSLEFTADTTSATADATPNNNSGTSDTRIVGLADLVLTKSGPTTVIAGEQITYTIIVTNNGPSTAQSVDVKDQLPAGVSLASASVTRSGSGNALCGGTVCQVGDMAINEVVTVTVVGNVDSTVADGTVVNNTATVFSDSPDPVSANNTNSAATTVSASADLSVAKTVSPNPAVPGETVTYQIVVNNAGPSAAADVKITDTIPTELTGVTVSPSQGTCTVGGNCDLGTIPAGGTATVTIVGTVNPAVTAGFTNSVTVGSPTTDPVAATTRRTAPSTVAPNADLALDIVSTPTTNGGTTATVTVTVQNNGPSNAVGTAVTVTLPASTTVNDISSQLPSGWTAVDNGNGTVTITTTNVLTSGQVVNLPIVVNVDPAVEPGTSLPFTGTTTSATADSHAEQQQRKHGHLSRGSGRFGPDQDWSDHGRRR